MKAKARRRAMVLERLEERQVLNAPAAYVGSPYALPTDGQWRNSVFVGSPIASDLDNDGRDELIVPVSGGRMVAFKADDAGVLQVFRTYDSGQRRADFKATPIVVTRADGRKLVFGGLGRDENRPDPDPVIDGRVFAFDALTGAVAAGWPRDTGFAPPDARGERSTSVVGPLAAGDLDADGVPEIVVTSGSDYVTAYRLDGSIVWRYDTDDTVLSGAAIGDLDRDGVAEVVVGSDTSENGFFQAGGFVNILNANGSAKYRYRVGETIWSSPTLVDLNGDGTLEIVVGTGLAFSPGTSSDEVRREANQVIALDFQGRPVPGWPYRTGAPSERRAVYSSPAAADLDGDGRYEIVVVDLPGFVHVIRSGGGAFPGFEGGRSLTPPGQPTPTGSFGSAVIADVNGDGAPDIVAATGGYTTALNLQGQQIFASLAPTPNRSGSFDQHFTTPVVAQLDGRGGLELVSMANLGAMPNPPSQLQVFQLPESTLAPPWPMQRRTASAQVVRYTPDFLQKYIRATLRALVARDASASDLDVFARMIQDQQFTLRSFAESVSKTPESRALVTRRFYLDYLGRAASDAEVNAGIALLADLPASELAKRLVTSAEFAGLTDGSPRGILTRAFEVILDRPVAEGEIAPLLGAIQGGALSIGGAVDQVLRREEFLLRDVIAPVVVAYREFFPVAQGGIDPAAAGAVLFDRSLGTREEDIRGRLIYGGENYASTLPTAGFVRSVYRDLAGREATTNEVEDVLRRMAAGRLNNELLVREIVNSAPARERFIRERVRALLGREADAGLIGALIGYANRDAAVVAILVSDEYFQKAGGNNTAFVIRLYRDLLKFDLGGDHPGVTGFVRRLNGYTVRVRGRTRRVPPEPRANIAGELLANPNGLDARVRDLLFEYVPDEDLGVLGTGNNDPNRPPLINPDPALVAGVVGLRQSGLSEDEVLVRLLTTDKYVRKTAFFRGFYRRAGIRV